MRKTIAAVATAATLSVGGLAVAALNPIQGASAQSGPSTTTPKSGDAGDKAGKRADRPHPLTEALDGLVKKGTLTQEQADAVLKAVEAQAKQDWEDWRKDHPDAGRPGRGPGGPGRFGLREGGEEVAKALGISKEDLRKALQDGKSIADVAKDEGVSEQKVIDAIVDAATKRIDQAVKDGKLDKDRAAKLKERLPEMAKRIVEAKKGDHPGFGGRFRGPGMRPGGFGGPGGPGGPGGGAPGAPGTSGGGI